MAHSPIIIKRSFERGCGHLQAWRYRVSCARRSLDSGLRCFAAKNLYPIYLTVSRLRSQSCFHRDVLELIALRADQRLTSDDFDTAAKRSQSMQRTGPFLDDGGYYQFYTFDSFSRAEPLTFRVERPFGSQTLSIDLS
jgi:hypothetical protein